MQIGYARTSTLEQVAGFEAQKRDLEAAGCKKVFALTRCGCSVCVAGIVMRKCLYAIAFLCSVSSFALSAAAQSTPDVPVSYGGYEWIRDRYEPDEFGSIGTFQGRSDVLRIFIGPDGYASNRDPGFGDAFYNYQGRKAVVNLHGSAFATGDLFVPGTWAAQQPVNLQSTGLWASVATGSDPNPFAYPIVAFSNSASGPAGRFQVWDDDTPTGWVSVGAPVKYDAWNTLRMEFHPGNRVDFYINGKLVYTDNTISTDPSSYIKELFLNSYNNNSEYEAFWANVLAGLLTSPTEFQIVGSVPGMTEFYQLNALGDFVSRRGLSATRDFSLQDNAWFYGGGLTGQFDIDGGTRFDGDAYYARFGTDVIQPFKGLRAGLTGSVGKARTDDISGSAEADMYSFGAYLTYVDKDFYVDVLGEYAWGSWDLSIPGHTSSDADIKGFAGSAETGVSIWLGNSLRLVPNAQAVLLSTDYDDVTFDMASAKFDSDDSLIGRAGARLQYELPQLFSGAFFYIGVSAVKDLAGDSSTILSSPAFAGALPVSLAGGVFEHTVAQISGGLDVKLTGSSRLYADVTYNPDDEVEAVRGTGGFSLKW